MYNSTVLIELANQIELESTSVSVFFR